jgi:hypothetical protein
LKISKIRQFTRMAVEGKHANAIKYTLRCLISNNIGEDFYKIKLTECIRGGVRHVLNDWRF